MAAAAVAAGVPVVPGAWWSNARGRFVCDELGCPHAGPHPALGSFPGAGDLLAAALREPGDVEARWRRPYGVLVPTGDACDVVDVPAPLGRLLLARRADDGPVVAVGGRSFFLTRHGGERPAPSGDVLVHGRGSWIMLPPGPGPGGAPVTWVVRPRGRDWGLPDRDQVLAALPQRGAVTV